MNQTGTGVFGLLSRFGIELSDPLAQTLPILMLFLLLQRHFIDGMAGGSTKG